MFEYVKDGVFIDKQEKRLAHWVCRKCGWAGSISEMIRVSGKPRNGENQECPACGTQGNFCFQPISIQ